MRVECDSFKNAALIGTRSGDSFDTNKAKRVRQLEKWTELNSSGY